jgi:multidrug efflux pump subunit AcrA (membrane-fusion protein)
MIAVGAQALYRMHRGKDLCLICGVYVPLSEPQEAPGRAPVDPLKVSDRAVRSFPYQHFGTYRGEVVKVSQTILTSTDASGPIKLNELAYRVTAALERPDIDAYGKKVVLQPDMLLKADIILERRSLMSWLTSPLLSVRM